MGLIEFVFFFFDIYLSNFVRETMKLTEVSVSDKLESFRASKEVLCGTVFCNNDSQMYNFNITRLHQWFEEGNLRHPLCLNDFLDVFLIRHFM